MTCRVFGILNRTPDSFYDGGRMDLGAAVDHGAAMAAAGADVLDIGAVRAGPGPEVEVSEEMDRLLPLVTALRDRVGLPLAIETARPEVAEAALLAGADIVNDVSGLADPELASVCSQLDAGLILMHNGGQIRGRPRNPRYEDVVATVIEGWREMVEKATSVGVQREQIFVDPGLDFGKTTAHSLELIRRLPELIDFGMRVLVAPSRKDVIGETLDLPPAERLEGTLAVVALCVAEGAAAVRVHDVVATVRVVRMIEAVRGTRRPLAPVRGLWE